MSNNFPGARLTCFQRSLHVSLPLWYQKAQRWSPHNCSIYNSRSLFAQCSWNKDLFTHVQSGCQPWLWLLRNTRVLAVSRFVQRFLRRPGLMTDCVLRGDEPFTFRSPTGASPSDCHTPAAFSRRLPTQPHIVQPAGAPPSHTHIPPDHVSQCSGCDMAHPPSSHTPTSAGRGGGGRRKGACVGGVGEGRRHYGDGGGDCSLSYPLPNPPPPPPPPPQHIHAYMCVCVRARRPEHMHMCVRHVTSSRSLHFNSLRIPACREREERIMGGKVGGWNGGLGGEATPCFAGRATQAGKGILLTAAICRWYIKNKTTHRAAVRAAA